MRSAARDGLPARPTPTAAQLDPLLVQIRIPAIDVRVRHVLHAIRKRNVMRRAGATAI